MIPLFSYLFISLALLRALFLFLFIFPTASFFYLERPLRRRSGPESLKRVLWWVPSALPQLPDPSVNWSFKTDTPRRSGRYWPTPLLHVYTFTSLHKNIWSPKQCTQTRALYRPERLSVLAVNQLSWLFSCDICQPLELLWPPFLLFIVFFFLSFVSALFYMILSLFFFNLKIFFHPLVTDRRRFIAIDWISPIDGTHYQNRTTWSVQFSIVIFNFEWKKIWLIISSYK